MKKLIIIAAIGKNNELGKNNDLIWKIKGDLNFFKEKTIGHTLLMGENTFFSLPKMLPDRKHIVLTYKSKDKFPKDVIVINSVEEFNNISKTTDDDIYIIGGASIYKQFIDKTDQMYLTEIDDECKSADVYFPKFNKDDYDIKIIQEHNLSNPSYKHVLYEKHNIDNSK